MKSGSDFLLAARQCEIAELERLAQTSELVAALARFIHAVQRERGISTVFLSTRGAHFADQRQQQLAECQLAQHDVQARFGQLDTSAGRAAHGSRLFSRVAVVVHDLEQLPPLRAAVAAQALAAEDAAAGYSRLVSGLLAVVFEAADNASDPEISRALVAMFNFMQGKEFASQERAFGARAFAARRLDAAGQQHWRHLVDSQQGCFKAFADFSDPQILRADHASRDPAVLVEVERLRRIGTGGRPPVLLDGDVTVEWYQWCTRRIDAMRTMEDLLALHLRQRCEQRIAQTRDELRDQRALLDSLAAATDQRDAGGAAPIGRQLQRSVLAMVQEQSRRLQAMSDELDAVRATLNERKVVERAKGLLMAHRQMSEDEAYKALRQMAMNQNRRLADVAGAVLSLADVLPG